MTQADCEYTENTENWQLPVSLVTTICNFAASIGCFYFVACILSKESTRSNTFNLFVVFLIIPDGLNTIANAMFGVFRAVNCGRGAPTFFGDVFDFNNFFYYFSNFYLNCCVAYELNAIVERSHQLMRTEPPPMKRMLLQVGCVYSLSFLFALWALIDVPWSFYDTSRRTDGTKQRAFGSSKGGPFSEMQATIFCFAMTLIPIIYVIAIRIRIWSKNLMRNEGRTRTIYLYFERIMVVFILMYFPGVTLSILHPQMERYGNAFYWAEQAIRMISALQSVITLYVMAQKPDIRKAVVCRRCASNARADEIDVDMDLERCDKGAISHTLQGALSDSLRASIGPFRESLTASATVLAATGECEESSCELDDGECHLENAANNRLGVDDDDDDARSVDYERCRSSHTHQTMKTVCESSTTLPPLSDETMKSISEVAANATDAADGKDSNV